MLLGKLDLFRHRDQDVLKINVYSPDLDHDNAVLKQLPNTNNFPVYNPHVTVAYLKPGTGEKYLHLSNPMQGREVTMGGFVFSDPDKKYSYLPLRAPRVQDAIELSATWGFNENDLIEMTTAMAVGTVDRPFGLNRPIFPSFTAKSSPSKRSRVTQPEASDPQPSRQLHEGFDEFPDDYTNHLNYTGIPYHLQVMDELEGDGWEHMDDGPKHSYFEHENVPGIVVHVMRRDEDPIWTIHGKSEPISGSGITDLKSHLKGLHHVDTHHEEAIA